jgi:1,3-beta-glucan synthase
LYDGTSKPAVNSWISYTRLKRSKLVGVKIRKLEPSTDVKYVNNIKPSVLSLLYTYTLPDFAILLVITIAYTFANSQNEEGGSLPVNSLLRLLVVSVLPIGINIMVLLIFFVVSIVLGPPITFIFEKFPSVVSFIVLSISVLNYVIFFEILWFLQGWDFSKTILGLAASISLQKLFFSLLNILFLSKEFDHDKSTRAWWSGKWVWAGLGWKVLTQPLREFICKITELSYFTGDIILGHIILIAQLPLILIPYADKWHSLMLFWSKPSTQRRPTCFTRKQRKSRVIHAILNATIFLFAITLITCIFIFPFVIKDILEIDLYLYSPDILEDYDLIQPMSMERQPMGFSWMV